MNGPQNFDAPEDRPVFATLTSRLSLIACVVLLIVLVYSLRPSNVQAAWEELEKIIGLKSQPLPASPATMSAHEIEDLGNQQPQQQAELLLERSINHYVGAIEILGDRVNGWCGQLNRTPRLLSMLEAAMNSNDLRVRAAGIEVYLAVDNIPKAPDNISIVLVPRLSQGGDGRYWALWMVGGLGNRGVEPDHAFAILDEYLRDSDETTRYWAVEGMALLGSDNTIQPLLDTFHSDPSPKVRERAACSLAQSGMLTKDQRMTAVPKIIDFLDDASVDAPTRGWAVQALNDITAAGLGPDPAAWRNWWAQHGAR
jgi:hypothetical protein